MPYKAVLNRSNQDFVLPLSKAQQSIILNILHERSYNHEYNIVGFLDIHGSIDIPTFVAALDHTVQHSTSLRTAITCQNDTFLALIHASIEPKIVQLDFSASKDPMHSATSWMQVDLAEPFNLTHAPLFKNAILRLSEQRYLWYLKYHHLIIDGFSLTLLGQYVANNYDKLRNEEHVDATNDLAIYKQYIGTHISISPLLSGTQEYPEKHLSAFTSSENEPDKPQESTLIFNLALQPEILERLRALSSSLEIGISTLLIGACVLFIHRTTGKSRILIDIPTHGRPPGPLRDLIAMCMYDIPICIDVKKNEDFISIVTKLRIEIGRATKTPDELRLPDTPVPLIEEKDATRVRINISRFNSKLKHSEYFGAPNYWSTLSSGWPSSGFCICFIEINSAGHLRLDIEANSDFSTLPELKRFANGIAEILFEITQ